MTSKLQKAIEQGSLEAVVAALDSGADIEATDMHGYPGHPLRTACFNGHRAIVLELLKRGADIHAPNAQGLGAPVRMAARGRHREIVLLLLEHGADVPSGVDLLLADDEVSKAKCVASIEYHPDTQIKEIAVSHQELQALFGNATQASEPAAPEDAEHAWDKIIRLD